MSAPLISASNISLSRKGKTILEEVSLDIHAGEFITIVGPNGAGKTVLLSVLVGLIKPGSGKIERSKNDLRIGYMPQRFVPEATLPITVGRFLKLGKKSITNEHISETLSLTGAGELINRPLHVLSGGELQRVLLARALLGNPDILVLDEPAQNLDISGELSFYKLIDQIYKQRKCAILMVSHDLHMVMASTSKVVCLFRHICCSGAPDKVTKDPAFSALFGNDMAKMVAVYQHSHDHDHNHEHHEHHYGEGGCDHHEH